MSIKPLNLKTITTAALLTTLLLAPTQNIHAEITVGIDDGTGTGNIVNTNVTDNTGTEINPIDLPANQALYIGYNTFANLKIDNGSTLNNAAVYFGFRTNSSAIVRVTDPNTVWNTGRTYLGNGGFATFKIYNGAIVNSGRVDTKNRTTITLQDPNTQWNINDIFKLVGTVQINNSAELNVNKLIINDGGSKIILDNGIINTPDLSPYTIQQYVSGTGTINTLGLVYENDITYQEPNNLISSWNVSEKPNQNITVNSDLTNTVNKLGAKASTLNLKNGVQVTSIDGIITTGRTKKGIVNLQNIGTKWHVKNDLTINHAYDNEITGQLNISDHATLIVDNELTVGDYNTAILNISNSATVNSKILNIGKSGRYKTTVNISGRGTSLNVYNTINLGSNHQDNPDFDILPNTLNISDNAIVTTPTIISKNRAFINLDNGTLNAIDMSPILLNNITGSGTVNTKSQIFDQTITLDNPENLMITTTLNHLTGQNVTVNTDLSDNATWSGAGLSGQGQLNIKNNVQLKSKYGVVGYNKNSQGIVNIQGPNTSWAITAFNGLPNGLTIGHDGHGTINVNDQATLSTNAITIGLNQGSTGILNIEGPNSKMLIGSEIFSGTFFVGREGNGTLNISNGAIVDNLYNNNVEVLIAYGEKSESVVNVSGYNSKWITGTLHVAADGNGTLNIANGAYVKSRQVSIARISQQTTSKGTVNVSGQNTLWENHHITFSSTGTATLNIKNGATVNTAAINLYNFPTSHNTININGNNSALNISDKLTMAGNLNISNGGKITNNFAILASDSNTPSILLSGVDTSWTTYNTLDITGKHTIIDINDGASMESNYTFLGQYSDSLNQINITDENSILTVNQTLNFINNGTTVLNAINGVQIISNNTHIGQRKEINQPGNGDRIPLPQITTSAATIITLNGPNTIWTNNEDFIVDTQGKLILTLKNNASILIGNDLTLSENSTFNIHLADPSESLLIDIKGFATFNGNINFFTDNINQLAYQDEFMLIKISQRPGGRGAPIKSNHTGQFQNIAEGDIIANIQGYDLIFSYLGGDGNDITITAIPEPTTLALLALAPLALLQRKQK